MFLCHVCLQVLPVKATIVATLDRWEVCQLADGQIAGKRKGESAILAEEYKLVGRRSAMGRMCRR